MVQRFGGHCALHPLPSDIKQMVDIQVSFLRQLCRLKKSVIPAIIFQELAEKPWVHRWWCQVLCFMHRLSNMPQSSIHVDILKHNISAAQQHPMCGNWAAGIVRQYASLGMPSPCSSSGVVALISLGFQANMAGQHRKVWDGLHVSPTLAPSKGAKLCTSFAWLFLPSQLGSEPYFDHPMPLSSLRLLMQFGMGSHSLPVEEGRLARPMVPRQLRWCTLCDAHAIGDERHYVIDCPHFAHICRQARPLFQDAAGAMQSFMWHRNQKAVRHCLAAILNLADAVSMLKHGHVLISQCWLNGQVEFSLSLSLSL